MERTERDIVHEILKKNIKHAFLATIDGDQAYIRQMAPKIEEDLSIWLITAKSSRKADQIKRNNKVCLLFVDALKFSRQATVYGEIFFEENKTVWNRLWNMDGKVMLKYFNNGLDSEEFCLMGIKIQRIEYRTEGNNQEKVYWHKLA